MLQVMYVHRPPPAPLPSPISITSLTDCMCVTVSVFSTRRGMGSVGHTAGNQYHFTTVPHNAAVFVQEIHPASVYTQPCPECTLSS